MLHPPHRARMFYPRERRTLTGKRTLEIARVRITEAGRRALASRIAGERKCPYAETRRAAMAAFAKSWRRKHKDA
jgi:hypothetical protein